MNISLIFLRIFFVILSVFFMTTFMIATLNDGLLNKVLIGSGFGLLLGALLTSFDILFRRFNLRSFNIALIGIFIGYLMGQALILVFNRLIEISQLSIALQPQTQDIIKISLFLFSTYLGTLLTMKSADEFYVNIPFVKFSPATHKKKDLLIDSSVLADTRIIDFAATGIVDHQLIIPRFIVKDLYAQLEIGDELMKAKCRRALEGIKKLEAMSHLDLRFNDTDFPETVDIFSKLTRLARLLDAHLLTADLGRLQMSSIEGIRIINIHALSNALKPLMQAGENIKIKIQRYGKEPRQGVGYLEDGTMVVVNGGGDYIGDLIDARVLSVKHTSSGRMIFCNAEEEDSFDNEYEDDESEHVEK